MWNQNLNAVSMISIFVHANVLALLWAPNMSGLNNSIGPIAWNCPKWRWATIFVGRSCPPNLCFEISGNKRFPMRYWFWEVLAMKIIQPSSLSSYFSVVVCLRWLYHHVLSVSYIFRKSWVLSIQLLCRLMMCAYTRVHYGPMVVFVCFHIKLLCYHHHYADLSEGIELVR